jgi:hypothetical protein
MLEKDLAVFLDALERATREVPEGYFQLPVAGKETPIYRERVYCYELYHRLRLALPADFRYSLAGEVDKSGHPIIRQPPLNHRKPDLLVHSPGNMERNLLAVEVKPGTTKSRDLAKDIETVLSCLRQAEYEYGMILLYGGRRRQWLGKLRKLAQQNPEFLASGGRFRVYWHEAPGVPATAVPWREVVEPHNNQTQRTAPTNTMVRR